MSSIRQQIIEAVDAKLKLITYAVGLGLGLGLLGIPGLGGGNLTPMRQQIINALDIRLKAIP